MHYVIEYFMDLFKYHHRGEYDLNKVKASALVDWDIDQNPEKPHVAGHVIDALYFDGVDYLKLAHRIKKRDAAGIGRMILRHLDAEAQRYFRDYETDIDAELYKRDVSPEIQAQHLAERRNDYLPRG